MISTGCRAMMLAATPATVWRTANSDSETPRKGPKKAPMAAKPSPRRSRSASPIRGHPRTAASRSDVAGDAGDHPHLGGRDDVVAPHPQLAEDEPSRLPQRAAEAEREAGARGAAARRLPRRPAVRPLEHGPADAGDGEDHPQGVAAAQRLAEHQPADERRQQRREGHHQRRDPRADQHVGPEQAEVAEDEADQPGDGEPPPGVGRGVDRQRQAAQPPGRQDQEAEGHHQADQVERQHAHPPPGGGEGEGREGPADRGAEGGELAEPF